MKRLIFLLSICSLQALGQQLPKVHVNHLFLVLDTADLAAIKNAGFVNKELAAVNSHTTTADSGETWTGTYLYGSDNYIELFDSSGIKLPIGMSGFGLSVDGAGELKSLDGSLHTQYKTSNSVRQRKMNETTIPWFNVLSIDDSTFFSQSHITWWVMEYLPAYFDYNHWEHNGNGLTRNDYLRHVSGERSGKLLKHFTGVLLRVTPAEKEYFTKLFTACGYKKIGNNELLSPDNFSIRFRERKPEDRYSIAAIAFESSEPRKEVVPLSDHVKIVFNKKHGNIVFQ
ncbi:DUF5829 family protein [Chitinophaga vietnamensis]|uniref:DUF5829 family protein n=1 Tax=Chitinophaga vietnamensis TaxID=2593957 RepID=UPI00117777AB|nr:DUF5829 family protein [Chitinophaga vietnamensis]